MRIRLRRTVLLITLCVACLFVFHNIRFIRNLPQTNLSLNSLTQTDSDNVKSMVLIQVLPDEIAQLRSNASIVPVNVSTRPLADYVQRPYAVTCQRLKRPLNLWDTQTFQKLEGWNLQTETFIFSAFWDIMKSMVRVIALSSGELKEVFCHLWYEDKVHDLSVVKGRLYYLPEDHGRRFTALYLDCPLPNLKQPYAVSLSNVDCSLNNMSSITNVLPVLRASGPASNFTVCITPLNFKYSRAYELVEMLELNRMLGADKFIFYVHSIGSNVESVLRWYAQKGLVELIDWKLPIHVDHWPPDPVPPDIHYFAQLASLNDCLNRNRNNSRYLVYEDIDEFIIPKRHLKWADMLADITLQTGKNMSAYIVASVFFRKDWPSNDEDYPGKALAVKYRSVVLATDKREQKTFPHSQRSKYIINPKGVEVVGIHDISHFRGSVNFNRDAYNVPVKIALLHHYRNWEQPNDAFTAVRDTDIYRFKDELLSRLEERWRELPQVPLDIPIDTYGTV